MSFSYTLPSSSSTPPVQSYQYRYPDLQHVIVFVWENGLLPMEWLIKRLSFGCTTQRFNQVRSQMYRNPYLSQAFSALETQVLEVVRQAMATKCSVYILPLQSDPMFFQASCTLFYPRLANLFSDPTVKGSLQVLTPCSCPISLRDEQASRIVETGVYELLTQRLFHSREELMYSRFSLVLVLPETIKVSWSELMKLAPCMVPKCLVTRMTPRDQPLLWQKPPSISTKGQVNVLNLEEFYAQLKTLGKCIHQSVQPQVDGSVYLCL